MKVNLDPENGLREAEDDAAPMPAEPFVYSGPSSESSAAAQARVQDVVLAALRGTLPRSRPLKNWEPAKLNARHIAMCCERASGATAAELSQRYRMHQTYINVILTHPDSIYIIGAIQALNADKMTDINARLQGYANEMLSMKIEVARTTSDKRLKDAIASDLLDRAGYGARQRIDLNALHRFAVPSAQASLISQALDEDKRVATVDYTQFTQRKLGEGALESGGLLPATPLPEQQLVTSASPGASPDALSAERKIA